MREFFSFSSVFSELGSAKSTPALTGNVLLRVFAVNPWLMACRQSTPMDVVYLHAQETTLPESHRTAAGNS
jgi:hypothetical protein